MTADEVLAYLRQRSVTWDEEAMEYGRRFRCSGGEVISAYDSGKITVQGKATPLSSDLQRLLKPDAGATDLARRDGDLSAEPVADSLKQVFIVYGHDEESRNDLELLLLKMGLKPIVLANMTPDGDTIIEKLERSLLDNPDVRFACVLLTPDDEGYSQKAGPESARPRARQNVILELGMVLSRLGRKKVAIFHKQSIELPSDINGMLYIPYAERVSEQKAQLFKILDDAGYSPDKSGL